jgi:hypothetical protein
MSEDIPENQPEDEVESVASPLRRMTTVVTIVFLVVVVALCLYLTVILILNLRRNNAPAAVAPQVVEILNPLLECTHLMPLPFGVKARNECYARCFSPDIDRDLCTNMCNGLLVENYARVPRSEDKKPEIVAKTIVSECAARREANKKSEPLESWKSPVVLALEQIRKVGPDVNSYEQRVIVDRFRWAEDLDKALRVPEGENPAESKFSVALQTALCIRQSLAATQMAVLMVAESGDLLSEKFYRNLEQELLTLLKEKEEEVFELKEKTSLSLPPNVSPGGQL